MTEFELIARFFEHPIAAASGVARGIGDDCALLDFGGPSQLAVTTDMLIAGRHFRVDADPAAIGHKALAVNLSDLAAAGAQPRCFFLAIGLPDANAAWLEGFCSGMFALADAYGCALAGGDTTRVPTVSNGPGPLTINITAVGEVPRGTGLTRAGARPGDDLWVSGQLGDAALALLADAGELALPPDAAVAARMRLDWPSPRVELGVALRGLATACIDISDGLVGDLGHVLSRSGVGGVVRWAHVPRTAGLVAQAERTQLRCALAGGDDYELAFTAPAARRAEVEAAAERARTLVTRVGAITDGRDLVVLDGAGEPMDMPFKAYDHFGSHEPKS
jgi:thiamine-monophosphate kinase